MPETKIKLEELHPNPYQPPTRVDVSEEKARRFGQSILEVGLLQIPVGRLAFYTRESSYEIGDGWLRLAGYRWLAANGHPEYAEMPVIIKEFTDQQMADLVLEANDVRIDFNPIERAWYYNKYLSDFPTVTQSEFARRHSRSQSEISNTIRLLELPEEVQQRIISHEISETHGRTLLQLGEPARMVEYAVYAATGGWSVSALDDAIKEYLFRQRPQKMLPELEEEQESIEEETQEQTETQSEEITEEETEDQPPVRTCRVCGCDEDHPCLSPKDGAPCHWVEADLCSACGEVEDEKSKAVLPSGSGVGLGEPPPAGQAETPQDDAEMAADVADKDEAITPAAEKPAVSSPAPPPSPAPATAPISSAVKIPWKRKVVIEEREDDYLLSYMKTGGMPQFKKLEASGSITGAINVASGWIEDLEAQWSKEEK